MKPSIKKNRPSITANPATTQPAATVDKGGRPDAFINWPAVDQYLRAGCSGAAVARMMGVHPNTLYSHCVTVNEMPFSQYIQEKRAEGDEVIRMAQYRMAVVDGDKTMLIWLGKNRLGQSDKTESKHEFTDLPIEEQERLLDQLLARREAQRLSPFIEPNEGQGETTDTRGVRRGNNRDHAR